MANVTQHLESRRARIGRWGGAAILVCALHVGGVTLALTQWQEEEDKAMAGALTVVMAPLPAPARVDTPDRVHGPLAEEVPPQPEASEKMEEEEVVEDLPSVPPSPAPEPEVALPEPPPEEKKEEPKKEEPKKEESKQTTPEEQRRTQRQEQQQAAAPPRVEGQSPPASAPDQSAATLAGLRARWQRALIRHFKRFRRYPEAARRRGQEGRVVVRFRVDRSGNVVASHLLKGSGKPLLDEDVFDWLKRSSPFPAPPHQIPESDLELDVPINYIIK